MAAEPGLQEYEDWLKGILKQAAQYNFNLDDLRTELKAIASSEEAQCSDCGEPFEMYLYDLCPKCVKRIDAMTPEERRKLVTCQECGGELIHEDGCKELTAKEYPIGDNGKAVLLAVREGEGPVVCTWGMGNVYDEEGGKYQRRCMHQLTEAGVKREVGDIFPYPETGIPDCDEDTAGKPAMNVKRQLVCPKHGVVDTFSTFILVEDLAALEPLWVS